MTVCGICMKEWHVALILSPQGTMGLDLDTVLPLPRCQPRPGHRHLPRLWQPPRRVLHQQLRRHQGQSRRVSFATCLSAKYYGRVLLWRILKTFPDSWTSGSRCSGSSGRGNGARTTLPSAPGWLCSPGQPYVSALERFFPVCVISPPG